MAKYTLELELEVATNLEPVFDYQQRIIGFKISDLNGGGELKPNICFEVMDNVGIKDGTDLSKVDDLENLELSPLEFDSFTREFTPNAYDFNGNTICFGDRVHANAHTHDVEGVVLSVSDDTLVTIRPDHGEGTYAVESKFLRVISDLKENGG